ncbi:hypothetical protein [Thioalkalivibrio sp. ALMg11]|uniref:hypothetical protein n=1 Tax=Thioalkalivibrio sp. ALMg11 TaxID=1158165 RepID=UPI0012DC76C5|nr:hypothetical protein [Thioalkalivibrio sp. ALMg11]
MPVFLIGRENHRSKGRWLKASITASTSARPSSGENHRSKGRWLKDEKRALIRIADARCNSPPRRVLGGGWKRDGKTSIEPEIAGKVTALM